MKMLGKHTYAYMCFPNSRLYRPKTSLKAVSAKPILNLLVWGCKCVLSCVLSTTLKDADIARRLNSRLTEKFSLQIQL